MPRKTKASRSRSSRRSPRIVIVHRDDVKLESEEEDHAKPSRCHNPTSNKEIKQANKLLFRAWKKTYENQATAGQTDAHCQL